MLPPRFSSHITILHADIKEKKQSSVNKKHDELCKQYISYHSTGLLFFLSLLWRMQQRVLEHAKLSGMPKTSIWIGTDLGIMLGSFHCCKSMLDI